MVLVLIGIILATTLVPFLHAREGERPLKREGIRTKMRAAVAAQKWNRANGPVVLTKAGQQQEKCEKCAKRCILSRGLQDLRETGNSIRFPAKSFPCLQLLPSGPCTLSPAAIPS